MTTRIIDGPCPVCGEGKENIQKITPDPDNHPEVFYFECVSCGYNESEDMKFPSHEA